MGQLRYVEIYEQFKHMILEGKMVEHQKLPSKRKLADNLKVSPLTVEAGYQQLIAEGYVYAIEKKGYFVHKQVELMLSKKESEVMFEHEQEKPTFKYNFETNIVDTSLFPNTTWARLSREVISENHHEMLNMTPPQGLIDLRIEISRYLEIYRGMDVSPDQIILGSGTTSMIGLLIELLGRKKVYAIEKPGYHRIEQLFKAHEVVIKHIPLDQMGIQIDHLISSHAHVVHVTPSHQYPTGVVMPISRRVELLNWAVHQQGYIIEDDYDSEFRFQGKPIPALQGLDHNDRVIYMNTFTKSLAPSFRMSYMVLPKHLMNRYHELSSYHGCTVPTFEQYVLYKFMHGGFFERHINRMRNHYRMKLEKIKSILLQYPNIIMHGDEAGLHFILEVVIQDSEEKIREKLKSSSFQITVLDEHERKHLFPYPCLLMGYSGISLEKIEEVCHELLHVLGLNTKKTTKD